VFKQLSANERRNSCRYPVADVGVELSWWEPNVTTTVVVANAKHKPNPTPDGASVYSRVMSRWPGQHNGTPTARATAEIARDPMPAVEESMRPCRSTAELLDISQTGVQVLSAAVPPSDQRIWLRLERPQVTDWVEGRHERRVTRRPGAHIAYGSPSANHAPTTSSRSRLYRKPSA